jgi:hypothetical protein
VRPMFEPRELLESFFLRLSPAISTAR